MLTPTTKPWSVSGRTYAERDDDEVEDGRDVVLRKHLEAVDAALLQARESIVEVKRALRFPLTSSTRVEDEDGS